MRRLFFFLTILFIAAGTPLSYSLENERQSATPPEAAQQKKQYEKSMEDRLKKLGKQLDELKTKAASAADAVRRDMHQLLADAERKQKTASRKLQDLRKKSALKWEKFTSETDAAMDEFEKAYERAKAHFKE